MSHSESTPWAAGRPAAYGLVAFGVVVAVAGNGLGSGSAIARGVVGVVAVAAMVLGIRRNRPAPASAWWLVAGGIALWVGGDALWDWLAAHGIDTPNNTHWADLVYLGGYVAFAVGQVLIGRARGREHVADGMLDGGVLAAAGVIVVWVTLIAPQQYAGMSAIDRAILAGYPLCDGLLLAGIGWLAFTPGRRGASLGFLATGMGLILAADLAWNVGVRFEQSWDAWLNPLYPIAYATLAAAALHPSVRNLTERMPTEETSVHAGRLTFLAAAMFAGPIAIMAADHDFGPSDVVVSLCSLMVVALVVGRFVGLVRENDRSRQRFRLLAESTPVGIYEIDQSLRIGYANTEADRLFGEAVDGRPASELLELIEPDDHERMIAAAERVLRGEAADAEFRLHAADGETRWVYWKGTPVPDRRRGYARVFASTLDVTALKQAQADVEDVLRRQATHDVLTGLPNRRLLSDRLGQALARRDRQPGTVALMFCDLDGFKTVNDVHGHDAGDAVLVEISRRLSVTVRVTDSVARIGGDEFVVLCEAAGTREDLAHLADKVVTAVNQPWRFEDALLTVGVSVGIGIAGFGDDSISLLRRADDAMYRAKASGRNRYEFAPDDAASRSKVGFQDGVLPEVARLHHVGEADR